MRRRTTPNWSSKRRAANWQFAGLVVAVAIGAFCLALEGPQIGAWLPIASAGESAVAEPGRGNLRCEVDYVTDGDTLRCRDGVRIRLHAVAARERDGRCSPGHPCPTASAEAATAQLQRLAGGKVIRCEPTGRSYNRTTAICWTPAGEEINCAMIQSGTAVVWDRFNRRSRICRG